MADVRLQIISRPHGYVQPPGEEFRVRASIRAVSLPGEDEAQNGLETVNREELEQDLRRYYEAYYAELGARTSRYPMMNEIFPDRMLRPRRVVAVLAADGVEVTHWPAHEQSFEFWPSTDRMVRDITSRERYVQAPSGMWADLFDYEAGADFGAFEFWGFTATENGVVVESEWTRLDVASLDNLDSFRDEAQARENAERDVQISTDAYLMGLDPAPPDQAQQERVIAELELAIEQFEQVLENYADDEKAIQLFLEARRNPILLDPSAAAITPKVKLGSEYELDFVIQVTEGQYTIVELKQPAFPVLTREGKLRAELTAAQQQVKGYFDWISRHGEYARTILPGINEPEGWVILGRRSSIPDEHGRVLARENAESRRITTMTYDDLLDRAKRHLANLRRL